MIKLDQFSLPLNIIDLILLLLHVFELLELDILSKLLNVDF